MEFASQGSVAVKHTNLLLRKSMHGLYIGALLFLGVVIVGTVAYCLEGWSFSNAFYMVVITVFSVGYQEVEPVITASARAITILTIVAGDASKVYFVGSLVRFITEGKIENPVTSRRSPPMPSSAGMVASGRRWPVN
jgi:voltage-gated potassium channel